MRTSEEVSFTCPENTTGCNLVGKNKFAVGFVSTNVDLQLPLRRYMIDTNEERSTLTSI